MNPETQNKLVETLIYVLIAACGIIGYLGASVDEWRLEVIGGIGLVLCILAGYLWVRSKRPPRPR